MKPSAVVALAAFAVTAAAMAAPFDGRAHDVLDLHGKRAETKSICQRDWNGLRLVVSNGTFAVTEQYWTHGGLTEIGPHATLTVSRRLSTGIGDAGIRWFQLGEKSRLVFDHVDWHMDHTRITVPPTAVWCADVRSLSLDGAMKDNLWDIAGRAVLVRGIEVRKADWGHCLTVRLRPGGELYLGGSVTAEGVTKGKLDVVLEGGRVGLFWDAAVAPGFVRVAPGATVEVVVAKGVAFDERVIAVPPDATLRVVRDVFEQGLKGLKGLEGIALPPRYPVSVRYDRAGRSYWLSADSSKGKIREMRVTYPNPDASSLLRRETATTADTRFRRRFPEGEGPWTVKVALVDKRGELTEIDVAVARPKETIKPPAPNDLVLVGSCGYGDALDLTRDVFEQDLCNLYVGWHSAAKLLPANWPEDTRARWEKIARERKMWAMSIYSGDSRDTQEKLRGVYGNRYLGNNIGEYASFMYQGRAACGIPMDLDLDAAKEAFVNRSCGGAAFGWQANFPWMFSTCGAALSCYELQGGIDFICNEQWAIGAMNIAHTTAEARGAARKWGPAYWCAWNAHEWQTCALPYRTAQKYDSCLVGFLSEYVMGTSMIVLESGAQGKQAWQYTSDVKGQPNGERAKEGYDGYVATHYRDVTKRFYDWVKANPRAKGTPETKIAMALGNLDAYLGQDGGFTVFSQHDRAAKDPARWKYGAPEKSQALLEDLFFPRPKDALAPYGNSWIGGTPYGQIDVMQIDDESTLADLSRYELLVFGGWNTMTPHVRDVLERYVRNGGALVLARPHLSMRTDRDFIGYGDKDLLPLFGILPTEGKPDAFIEKRIGKGRYFLFTAHGFPAATAEGAAAYRRLVAKLAESVPTHARIAEGPAEYAVFAVYDTAAYLLNADAVKEHEFVLELDGRRHRVKLAPCGIKVFARETGELID